MRTIAIMLKRNGTGELIQGSGHTKAPVCAAAIIRGLRILERQWEEGLGPHATSGWVGSTTAIQGMQRWLGEALA